jgi:hypothetical protein
MISGRLNADTGNVELALKSFDEALIFVNRTPKNDLKKDILKLLASVHSDNDDQEKAIEIVNEALQIDCHVDSSYCLIANISLLINKGSYLSLIDKYQDAIEIYNEADSLVEALEVENPLYSVVINNSLAIIHVNQSKNNEEALLAFKKAWEYCPDNHPFKTRLVTNIAAVYKNLGMIDSTKALLKRVINSSDKPSVLVSPYQTLGVIEMDSSKYSSAILNFKKALEFSEQSGQDRKIIKTKMFLAQAYYLSGDYKVASKYINEVDKFHENNSIQKTRRLEIDKYKNLIAVALLNPKRSIAMNEYLINYDSLYGEERQEKLDKLLYKYENRIVSDSLASLKLVANNQELELKNQNLSITSLILALLAGAFAVFVILGSLRKSKAENKELVFKNQELENLNQKLRERSTAIQEKKRIIPVASNIQFKSNDKTFIIEPDRVRYVQAEAEGTRIFFDQEDRWTDLSLKQLNNQLTDDLFIQVFRSTIVNLQHIDWINTTTLQMKDGTKLKIGRTYKKKIQKALGSEEE